MITTPDSFKIKSNNILISAKKIESESRKRRVEDKIKNLMDYLWKILNYEKIHEVSFSVIYNLCYNISIEKGGQLLQEAFEKILSSYILILFEECQHYQSIDEAIFLRKLVDGYFTFIKKIEIIQKTLLYHEKNYLVKNNLTNIKVLAKSTFELFCITKIKSQFVNFITSNCDKDRDFIFIDKLLIKDLVNLLLDLNDTAYEYILQSDLLECAKQYYISDFVKNISKSPMEYSLYVKQRISNEEVRISELNLTRSKSILLVTIAESLVLKFIQDEETIIPYIISLVKISDTVHLNLLKQISLFHLQDKFIEILAKSLEIQGKELINEKCCYSKNISNANICSNSEDNLNLVNSLVDFFDKIDLIKKDLAIHQHKLYCEVISSRLNNVINNKDHHLLIPKILPKHIDHNFKNFLRIKPGNSELVIYVEKIINLIRYVLDKDVFELNHRNLLSFRLLNGLFYEEIETKFLAYLKLENGAVYTHRCEVMINDLKSSGHILDSYLASDYSHKKTEKLNESFNKLIKGGGVNEASFSNKKYPSYPDFNIKVLTGGNWLLNNDESISSQNIISMADKDKKLNFLNIMSCFNKFYSFSFPNKILCHNLFLGSCDVLAKFPGRNYSLNLTPFAAFALIYIDASKQEVSLNCVLNYFKIKETKAVINNLISLIKSELIHVDNFDALTSFLKQINVKKNEVECPNITININNKFYNKQQRLKISSMRYVNEKITQNEEKADESVVLQRKYIVESNIIRIMKSSKMIAHNDLLSEVLLSVNSYFTPDINSIKQRIESLIERGYITRSKDNYTNYEYTF